MASPGCRWGRRGGWLEVLRPRVERYETIFGRAAAGGVAVLAEQFSGPIREHAYWGSMRDRLPAAQTDPLHDPGALAASGTRIGCGCGRPGACA